MDRDSLEEIDYENLTEKDIREYIMGFVRCISDKEKLKAICISVHIYAINAHCRKEKKDNEKYDEALEKQTTSKQHCLRVIK